MHRRAHHRPSVGGIRSWVTIASGAKSIGNDPGLARIQLSCPPRHLPRIWVEVETRMFHPAPEATHVGAGIVRVLDAAHVGQGDAIYLA